jgi:hypothetical protein
MKTKIAFGLSLSVLAAAGTALAAITFTAYVPIRNLDATPEGMRVYQPGSASTNPKGCANTDYYEPAAGISVDQRDAFDKVLVSAFLAGRKIKLGIDTLACGANGRPAYQIIRLDEAN